MQSYLKPDILKLNNVSREYRGISMTCSDAAVEYIMTTNLEYRLCVNINEMSSRKFSKSTKIIENIRITKV